MKRNEGGHGLRCDWWALLPLDVRRLIWCEVGPLCTLMVVSREWYQQVATLDASLLVPQWLADFSRRDDWVSSIALGIYLASERSERFNRTHHPSQYYMTLAYTLCTISPPRCPSMAFFRAVQRQRHREMLSEVEVYLDPPDTATVQDLFVMLGYVDARDNTTHGAVLVPLLGFSSSVLSCVSNIVRGDWSTPISRTTRCKYLRLFGRESQTWNTLRPSVPRRPKSEATSSPIFPCIFASDLTEFYMTHPTLLILEQSLCDVIASRLSFYELRGYGEKVYSEGRDGRVIARHLIERGRDAFDMRFTLNDKLLLCELDALARDVPREKLQALHVSMVAETDARRKQLRASFHF